MEIFTALLQHLKPHAFYEKKEDAKRDDILIIDSPNRTLRHPLLDFDVRAATNIVIAACEQKPAERSKPLVAALRGIGGGKTRTLVELWLELNKSPHVLALAITFNSVQSHECDQPITEPGEMAAVANACYVRMVISRMASVFFGWDFRQARQQLGHKSVLDAARVDPEGLLRSFVTYLVSRCTNQKITHFVLLVDETAAAEKMVFKSYKQAGVTSILRNGLLSNPTYKAGTKHVLHVGLVMTSLELSPIGPSSRAVNPLELFLELSPDEIVKTWWGHGLLLSPILVRFAASLFASMPRLVEIADAWLPKVNTFEDLLTKMYSTLKVRYIQMMLPELRFLRAVVLRERIKLDTDVMLLIGRSMFVNCLTVFEEEGEIVPESNVFMLVAAAKNTSDSSEEKDLLVNMLQFEGCAMQAGDLLELLFYRWMNFRFMFMAGLDKEVALGTLLQLGPRSNLSLLRDVPAVHPRHFVANLAEPPRLKYSSYSNKKEFAAEIAGLPEKGQALIYLSHQSDAFDLLLVFGKWLLFIDAKSCDEKESSSTRTWRAQADHMKKVIEDCQSEVFSGWFYIYFTTHDVPPSAEGCVITLGRSVAKAFFGPLWPCYQTLRSEWNK